MYKGNKGWGVRESGLDGDKCRRWIGGSGKRRADISGPLEIWYNS